MANRRISQKELYRRIQNNFTPNQTATNSAQSVAPTYNSLEEYDKAAATASSSKERTRLQADRRAYALDNEFERYEEYLNSDEFERNMGGTVSSPHISTAFSPSELENYQKLIKAQGKYGQVSQDEIDVAKAFYNSSRFNDLRNYMKDMDRTWSKRRSDELSQRAIDWMNEGNAFERGLKKTGMYLGNTIVNQPITGAIAGATDLVSNALGKEVNPYDSFFDIYSNMGDAMQSDMQSK